MHRALTSEESCLHAAHAVVRDEQLSKHKQAPVVSEPAMKKMRYSSTRRRRLSGLPSGSFSDSRWPACKQRATPALSKLRHMAVCWQNAARQLAD